MRWARAARVASWVTMQIVAPALVQLGEQLHHRLGILRVQIAGGLVGQLQDLVGSAQLLHLTLQRLDALFRA